MGTFAQHIKDDGVNILGRWTRTFEWLGYILQADFDKERRGCNESILVHIGTSDSNPSCVGQPQRSVVGWDIGRPRTFGEPAFHASPPERTVRLQHLCEDEYSYKKTLSLTVA